jgi:hypothetical protein
MILVWNDVKSFNRHLENMRQFRQHHLADEKRGWIIRDMPVIRDVHVPLSAGGAGCFFDVSPRAMVIPLWEITLPKFLQN